MYSGSIIETVWAGRRYCTASRGRTSNLDEVIEASQHHKTGVAVGPPAVPGEEHVALVQARLRERHVAPQHCSRGTVQLASYLVCELRKPKECSLLASRSPVEKTNDTINDVAASWVPATCLASDVL